MANEIGKGWGSKTGIKKEAVYGTPAAVGSGDLLWLHSEQLITKYAKLFDDSISGSAGVKAPDAGNTIIKGSLKSYLRYWNKPQMLLLALGMGACGTAEVASPVYKTNLKLSSSLEGLFATLAIDKVAKIYEYESIKINDIELKCTVSDIGSRIELTAGLIARDLDRASSVNTSAQIGNLTLSDASYPAGYVLSNQLTAYLAASSGGALGAGNEIKLKGFSLKIENNLCDNLVESGNDGLISQPVRNGHRKVTLRLELGKYQLDGSADTWNDAYMNNTALKCRLSFLGELISGSSYNRFDIYFPCLSITDSQRNVSSTGLIEAPLELIASLPDAAVDGMENGDDLLDSDVLEEMRITLQNRQTASVLA